MTLTSAPLGRAAHAARPGSASVRHRSARAALAAALTVLASLLVVPAASASGTEGTEPAWLRPAHLVPGLGPMDIRLSPFSAEGSGTALEDQPLVQTTASYGAVGQYGAIPAGSYAVSVRPAGSPVSTPPLLSLTVDLEAGQAYTVVGLGSEAEPRLERLVDDLTPPGDGSANVRLLPASLTAPTVDVQAEGGPVLAQDAALGRPTGYTTVPAGPWTVTAAGGGASGSTDLVLDSGTVYTLLVLDSPDGTLVVQPVVDAAGTGATPVGGAETGVGATGDRLVTGPAATGLLVGGLVAAGLGVLLAVLGLAARTVPAAPTKPAGARGRPPATR